MSGNGIRCLAQAVFQAGIVQPPVLHVATDAGPRIVRVLARSGPATHRMSVEMGQAKVVGAEPEWVEGDVLRANRVDVGNPHLVLHWAADPPAHASSWPSAPASTGHAGRGQRRDHPARPDARRADDGGVRAGRRAHPGVRHRRVRGGRRGPRLGAGAAPPPRCTMPGGPVEVTLGDPVLLTGDATSVATIYAPWP